MVLLGAVRCLRYCPSYQLHWQVRDALVDAHSARLLLLRFLCILWHSCSDDWFLPRFWGLWVFPDDHRCVPNVLGIWTTSSASDSYSAYLLPGKPVANMYGALYGQHPMSQGIALLQDLKLGQYVKLAPRVTFLMQVVGTHHRFPIFGHLYLLLSVRHALSSARSSTVSARVSLLYQRL